MEMKKPSTLANTLAQVLAGTGTSEAIRELSDPPRGFPTNRKTFLIMGDGEQWQFGYILRPRVGQPGKVCLSDVVTGRILRELLPGVEAVQTDGLVDEDGVKKVYSWFVHVLREAKVSSPSASRRTSAADRRSTRGSDEVEDVDSIVGRIGDLSVGEEAGGVEL